VSFLGRGKGFQAILISFGGPEKKGGPFEHSDQIQCNLMASV
jgi:hypothetical protein